MKKNKFKTYANQALDAVKSVPNVWKNLQHLVEAASLVAVGGTSYWLTYNYTFSTEWQSYALRFAAVVIALRGAVELIKHLNRR